jgi:hypothetical protein
MVFTLEPINIAIGAGIALIIWLVISLIFKFIKPKKSKTSLPQMKKKVVDSYNSCIDVANNLLDLKQVFDEIKESK